MHESHPFPTATTKNCSITLNIVINLQVSELAGVFNVMALLDGGLVRLGFTVFVGLLGLFFFNLYRVRSHVRSLQKQGMVSGIAI